jgi:hypothetical protein
VNISGSPVHHVGGLGLLTLIVLVSVTSPSAWWIPAFGVAGGVVLGILLVLTRRVRPMRSPPAALILSELSRPTPPRH